MLGDLKADEASPERADISTVEAGHGIHTGMIDVEDIPLGELG